MRCRGSQVLVDRPRFQLRGWNGAAASPIRDLTGLLDKISRDFGRIPVVLVGHSMGARAALRVAGHPMVSAVAGLAPWLPPGEPVSQLAGRRILLVHGSDDRTCNPEETWAYAGARPVRRAGGDDRDAADHWSPDCRDAPNNVTTSAWAEISTPNTESGVTTSSTQAYSPPAAAAIAPEAISARIFQVRASMPAASAPARSAVSPAGRDRSGVLRGDRDQKATTNIASASTV